MTLLPSATLAFWSAERQLRMDQAKAHSEPGTRLANILEISAYTRRADAHPRSQNPSKVIASLKRNAWLWLLAACLIHLILASALACTNLPLVDEAFYGIPAYTLASTGKLQNHVVESAGVPYLTGIDRVFYWMIPLGMVIQAAAFKVFGFSIFTQRAVSVSCGVGTLVAWFLATRKLLGKKVAALSCLFLSIDFVFCSLSSRGRADMMSLFFGSLALAAYLNLRDQSLRRALLAANASCALSALIHPNGGVAALISLVITILYLDWRRIRLSEVCLAALPYLIFGAGLAAYISLAPDLWVDQFIGNVRYRVSAGNVRGFRLFTGEFIRYANAYNVPSLHDPRAPRLLIPVSYGIAALGCLTFLRSRIAWLLALFGGQVLALMFLEGTKQGWYAVHIIPVLTSLLAVWELFLWQSGRKNSCYHPSHHSSARFDKYLIDYSS